MQRIGSVTCRLHSKQLLTYIKKDGILEICFAHTTTTISPWLRLGLDLKKEVRPSIKNQIDRDATKGTYWRRCSEVYEIATSSASCHLLRWTRFTKWHNNANGKLSDFVLIVQHQAQKYWSIYSKLFKDLSHFFAPFETFKNFFEISFFTMSSFLTVVAVE